MIPLSLVSHQAAGMFMHASIATVAFAYIRQGLIAHEMLFVALFSTL
jgi:hypothetical protein